MLVHFQNAFGAMNCTILLHKPNPNGFSDCTIVPWVSVAFFLISIMIYKPQRGIYETYDGAFFSKIMKRSLFLEKDHHEFIARVVNTPLKMYMIPKHMTQSKIF